MCNLSLHKHNRSRPTLGVNATDLSYTSEAQLEEEGKKDLFNLNFNLHRALCKCMQADALTLRLLEHKVRMTKQGRIL